MKKIHLLTLFALFAFLLSAGTIKADESTASTTIKYDLAYPGILPDNPLYKIKVLRDKISTILIQDPAKKAEFYLLQADKGILAAAMLVDKNKIDLAEKTALKAENNVTLLTYEFYKFAEKPKANFFKKLKTASLKHQEVLASLIKRVSEDQKGAFQRVINFSKTNVQTIGKFENKRFYSSQ